MMVEFQALIKQITTKSLVSGDKESRLLLEFMPSDELLDGLNRLHKADKMVNIKITSLLGE